MQQVVFLNVDCEAIALKLGKLLSFMIIKIGICGQKTDRGRASLTISKYF